MLRRLVIGVGINIRNSTDLAGLPKSDLPSAISIDEVRQDVTITEVARSVLTHLERTWKLFNDDHSLQRAWQVHCLLTGRSIRWQSTEKSRTGICQGIDNDGALLLAAMPTEPAVKCYGGTVIITDSLG